MFLLVHSPLVGPATWRRVAEALRWWGHDVTMPDLTEAAATGAPDAAIRAAIPPQATETPVLVGHSGAGFFLPSIAAVLGAPARRLVFVDAGIPPGDGEASAGARDPPALYESPIVLPTGWRTTPGAFLLLSEPWRQEAQTATSLGWPVVERLGTHLDIVNDPESVARDLVALAS
jgi:pimeloyl-ACP methyl ester carboxylesterase